MKNGSVETKNIALQRCFTMAGQKGFEPSIFSVTGRHVNRATPDPYALFFHLTDRDVQRTPAE